MYPIEERRKGEGKGIGQDCERMGWTGWMDG